MLGFVPLTFGFSVTFLAPVFNQEALAGNASTLSLLLSATGIGALAGSLILARLGKIEEKGKTTVGQAADTDTLVASANAYINALNKMIIKRDKTAPGENFEKQNYETEKMKGI